MNGDLDPKAILFNPQFADTYRIGVSSYSIGIPEMNASLSLLTRLSTLTLVGLLFWFSGQSNPITSQEDLGADSDLILNIDSMAPPYFQPAFQNGKVHDSLLGKWRARGYGFVFDVSSEGVRWFSETGEYAWEHSPEEFDVFFAIEESSGRCYIKPYPTESAVILEPLSSLDPKFKSVVRNANPETVFRLISETMTDYYAFFDERGIDWEQRLELARNKISKETTETQLWAILKELFAGLNDGHTTIEGVLEGKRADIRSGGSSLRKSLDRAFENQNVEQSFGGFFRNWWGEFTRQMEEELLQNDASSAFDDTLVWGRINDQVGYLYVKNMYAYAEEDLVEGLTQLHNQLETIFEELSDCEALMIDVSTNSGGFHSYALAFASHIADRRRFTMSKYPIGHPDLLQKFDVLPYRDSTGAIKTFTKPVYVIVSDATVSAGEEFVLAARAFPHVEVVGTRTNGMLSDMLEKPLPNGWTLNLSNEVFLSHEGVCFEAIGIPATIDLKVFDLENVTKVGHAQSLRKFAESLPGN